MIEKRKHPLFFLKKKNLPVERTKEFSVAWGKKRNPRGPTVTEFEEPEILLSKLSQNVMSDSQMVYTHTTHTPFSQPSIL